MNDTHLRRRKPSLYELGFKAQRWHRQRLKDDVGDAVNKTIQRAGRLP